MDITTEAKYVYLDVQRRIVCYSSVWRELDIPKLQALGAIERITDPDLTAVVGIPFEYWKMRDEESNVVVEMTAEEKEAVTPGEEIHDEDIRYIVETVSQNRITEISYYTDEISSPTGFSGFSGLGKKDFYSYQGSKIMGFSSVRYDTKGAVFEVTSKTFATGPNGEHITRIKEV